MRFREVLILIGAMLLIVIGGTFLGVALKDRSRLTQVERADCSADLRSDICMARTCVRLRDVGLDAPLCDKILKTKDGKNAVNEANQASDSLNGQVIGSLESKGGQDTGSRKKGGGSGGGNIQSSGLVDGQAPSPGDGQSPEQQPDQNSNSPLIQLPSVCDLTAMINLPICVGL